MTDSLLDPTNVDPNIKSYRDLLVGPEQKFKTDEDLAKGKYLSDSYIKILEGQLDNYRKDNLELREENQSKAKLEEIIDRLENRKSPADNTQPSVMPDKLQPEVDFAKIKNFVNSEIQSLEASKKEQANQALVKSKLIERYGPNYHDAVTQQIENLDLTSDEFDAMAKRTPKALLKTLGLDVAPTAQGFQAPPRGTQRNDSFQPTASGAKPWSHYKALQKSDPQAFLYNKQLAVQMHKDLMELGENAFYDVE